MLESFPYKILKREEIIHQINALEAKNKPFLFIIDFKAQGGYVIEEQELDARFVRFETPTLREHQPRKLILNHKNKLLVWNLSPLFIQDYTNKFERVKEQIQKGNSFLANLTQPTDIETNATLEELYDMGFAKYKLWLKNRFAVLSPECFVQIKEDIISSYPMKGTIDASLPNAEEIILTNPKEKAEHATIVDLIRNDLSSVATNVKVEKYRYIDKLTTNKGDLLQVSSKISGELRKNYHQKLGDILFALLPAGSISGAPKHKTLEIIDETEGYDRGFYTGIFGWFDGRNLDSGVMIRFIEQKDNQYIFKSGGGITSQSEVQEEYNELIQKIYVPLH